jgi:hypothetical protein
MTAVIALVRTSVGDSDPYIAPALLAACGAAALIFAWRRRTTPGPGGRTLRRRVFVGGLAALALVAFVIAGVDLAGSASLFWGVAWEGDNEVLVLERMGPLGSIRIPRADVASVGTLPSREHTLAGSHAAMLFVIHTRSGASYWSAPVRSRAQIDRVQETLAQARDRRGSPPPGAAPSTN